MTLPESPSNPAEQSAHQGRGAKLARKLIVDFSVLATICVVLALLAPLGTGAMPFVSRLAYWMVMGFAGYCFYNPLGMIIVGLAPKLDLPEWALWVATVLIATVPMATVVWVVNFLPGEIPTPSLEQALSHYFTVLVVGAVITVTFNLVPATRTEGARLVQTSSPANNVQKDPVEPDASTLSPTSVRFIDRLPAELGTDLIALEMEDHYVRAHTALGSELVLMRLRDAVAELDGLEGMQVHRSWWAARGAVEDVKREGRNIRLVLTGGLEAPVSRANVTPLKEQGWF